jgi:hypothetical protein
MTNDTNHGNLPGKRRLARISDIPTLPGYEWTTQSYLRHAVFDAKDRVGSGGTVIPGNGLASAIIRIGRRVLIDLDRFDAWIEIQREGE